MHTRFAALIANCRAFLADDSWASRAIIDLPIPSLTRSLAAAACSLVVVSLAFGFAPGDDAPPLQSAELGCDHGEAVFDVAVVAKQDHPIACPAQIMCTRSV